MDLPPNIVIDHVVLDRDLDDLTGFVQRCNMAESGRTLLTRDEIETRLKMPGVDLPTDTLILRDGDGAMVGAEWVAVSAPHVQFRATGFVDPGRIGEGIGTAMIDWARGRATEQLGHAPDGARVVFTSTTDADHRPGIELFESRGMGPQRYFLEMRVDFDGPPPQAAVPDGISIRNYVAGEDDVPIYNAITDAFRDHFGFVDKPQDEGLAVFRTWVASPMFDPALWWIAEANGEAVASNVCWGSVEGDDGIGYVASLGVRKPWRGRGLAAALLSIAFGEFWRRGKHSATLHVDADSLTGATRLYRKVGMRETERFVIYAAVLREGTDLSTSG